MMGVPCRISIAKRKDRYVMDPTFAARVQFGMTLAFHYIFPPITIGLGLLLVFMEGTFLLTRKPIYERLTTTTMSGTNPDGSHYSDPGVKWVNYFSGGSAVHGFPRASYGSPQSVGCLELRSSVDRPDGHDDDPPAGASISTLSGASFVPASRAIASRRPESSRKPSSHAAAASGGTAGDKARASRSAVSATPSPAS